jgi:hypothetical protein
MIKIAKELNKVIDGLEQMGFLTEASSIHNVFVKVAQMGGTPGYQGTMGTTGNYQAPQNQTVAQQASNQMGQPAYKGNPAVYQFHISAYKNTLYQEAKTSNDSTLPQTSAYFRQVMASDQLTDQEKQAFRAQAYRIRQEAQLSAYGTKQPEKNADTINNLPLQIQNLVQQSNIMKITDPQQLEKTRAEIYNKISKAIQENVPQQQQQQYLKYALGILSSYFNSRSATLGVQAQQQPQQPQQPVAQQSPVVSPQ